MMIVIKIKTVYHLLILCAKCVPKLSKLVIPCENKKSQILVYQGFVIHRDCSTIIYYGDDEQSRASLCQPHAWLIPANPHYYDIMHAFSDPHELLLWKQSTKIRVGDPVFIYVTSPVKAVVFQCQAVQVNIPYHYRSKQVNLDQAMKLSLVKRYPPTQFSFDFLKAHGIQYIRGPRKLSKQLVQLLNQLK